MSLVSQVLISALSSNYAYIYLQVPAEQRQRQGIAAHSRSSTKAVVITVAQEENTIDHGVLSHLTLIETRSGATVLVRVWKFIFHRKKVNLYSSFKFF